MKISLFKTFWGHEGTYAEAARLCAEADFEGFESPFPTEDADQEAFLQCLSENDLLYIAEISTATVPGFYVPSPGRSADEHLASLREGIEHALPARPLFINTMCGSDAWSPAEALSFYSAIPKLEAEYEISISAETHRGRYLNSAWATRDILREVPDLKLTCDFSHFCVVAERLVLDEEPEILDLCARHAFHLQTRVGYNQGPQVPDPRAPEHAGDLAAHESWWDKVWESQIERGFDHITITPEFGPDGYLHCEPFTQKPVGDLWEINTWIAHRQRNRLQSLFST